MMMDARRERCFISFRREDLERLTTAELVWTAGATGHRFADWSAVTRTDIIKVLAREEPHLLVAELWPPDGRLELKDRRWLASQMALAKVDAPVKVRRSGINPQVYLILSTVASIISVVYGFVFGGSIWVGGPLMLVSMLFMLIFISKKEEARWRKKIRR